MSLMYEQESYAVLGACFEVYKEKDCGFVEPVYHECLAIELELQQIPFVSKRPLQLIYKGRPLTQRYEPDFVCFGRIIVELKSASALCDEHRAQVHNYLRATGLRLGLLVNFNHYPKVQFERIIL